MQGTDTICTTQTSDKPWRRVLHVHPSSVKIRHLLVLALYARGVLWLLHGCTVPVHKLYGVQRVQGAYVWRDLRWA